MREEARGKKQIKDDKTQNSVVESYEKLSREEENEKKIQIRNDFLDQLYKLVDGHVLSDARKYVIIFNTNNFNGLFLDTDDRYKALIDRFQKYKFNKIGKAEIISYLKCITNELKKKILESNNGTITKLISDKKNIANLCAYDERVLDRIPDNISITYRTLHKILRSVSFKTESVIDILIANDFETTSL